MAVKTQFPKRGILNQFPGPRLVYLDNYARHMHNFTGSEDCLWGGGGLEAGSNHFITQKQ